MAIGTNTGNSNGAVSTALHYTLGDLSRRFGDTTVMRLGESRQLYAQAISTGFVDLDKALSFRITPHGRPAPHI